MQNPRCPTRYAKSYTEPIYAAIVNDSTVLIALTDAEIPTDLRVYRTTLKTTTSLHCR